MQTLFFQKTRYLNEEVNRIELSPSFIVPILVYILVYIS